MRTLKVHHIGYVVRNIQKAYDIFVNLGMTKYGEIFWDDDRLSKICFLRDGEMLIELIEPQKGTELYALLKHNQVGPYHICYQVKSIDDHKDDMLRNGFLLFKDKQNARAIAPDAVVAFFMSPWVGMVELVEFVSKKA